MFGKKTELREMNETSHLISLADEYLRATGTKDVTLSFWVFNDSKKLTSLRAGSDITLGRFNAAVGWFVKNWPEGAVWPHNIPFSAEAFDAVYGVQPTELASVTSIAGPAVRPSVSRRPHR